VQIYKRGRTTHWVDGRDPQRSNWLRYINCASSVESQNVTACQTGGDIYYRTAQTIKPNTELLVWYGDDYAAELGLISVGFLKSLDVINICKFPAVFHGDVNYAFLLYLSMPELLALAFTLAFQYLYHDGLVDFIVFSMHS